MKKARSRKNLWDGLPRPAKALLGAVLGRVPPQYVMGRQFRESLGFAEDSQWWPAERSREYQVEALRRICTLAYEKTAYYRRMFDAAGFRPGDLKSPEDLRRLPTIDKYAVRTYLAEMCARPVTDPDVDYVSTGGTSGVPLFFYIGSERSAIEYAYLASSWERIGYDLKLPMAVVRGRIVQSDFKGLRHDYDPLLRHHYYSAFHMANDDMRKYLEHIRGLGPCYLHAYPSSAANLARFIEREGLAVPRNIRGILVGSENVYAEQRAFVEQVFGVRCFSWYGHSEKLVLAAECEQSTDYHVWPTYGFFELLDKQGRPVTTAGQRGEIVGTGFINTVVPFIRYRTGDYATYVADRCVACGRQHPMIREVRGHRIHEMLVAADGSEISWTAVNMHDDTFAEVRRFQFFQEVPGRATLRVIPTHRLGEADIVRIRRHLEPKLQGRVAIDVEVCREIPESPSGKAIYVDQRIGNTGGAGPRRGAAASSEGTFLFTMIDRRIHTGHAQQDLPPPPDLPGTCVLEPLVVYQAVGITPSPALVYPHPVRKLLAFICQEGPVWTWRKAMSARLSRRIEAHEALVVVVGRSPESGKYYVGCGRQFSPRLARMLFREELVFEAESEAEADAIAQHITRLLRGRPELACRLVDFSPHSPEPAPLLPEMPRRTLAMPRRDPSVQARASSIAPRSPFDGEQENHLFLVGAGAYAVVFVLPLLNRLRFDTLIEYNPLRASVIGRKFGFRQVETDYRRVLDRASSLGRITVVVANYHSHHADTAIQFMEANSRACVMIEKPSVIGYEQFERLLPYVKDKTRFVEIGFNRRYTSMIRRTKRLLEGRRSPLTLTCIISEDAMEPAHWYFWATEGTRVYGNLCHWIDLGVHLVGSRPVEIAAMADRDFQAASNVSIRFEDGSLVNLVCGERGDGLRGVQEYIDLRTDQLTVQIHDFRRMVVLQDGRRHVYRSLTRDKGHTEMYRVLSHAVLNLLRPQYTSADFVRTAVLTEEIHRMLGSGRRHNDIDMSTLERWEGEPLS